jgi:heme-degrading monooxygenase HmoA
MAMYIAMNRFKVKLGSEAAFEKVWRERPTYLAELPGFVEFSLLRGATTEDHTLYSSHTVWATKADFENWTKSQAFRDAHKNAGNNAPLYLGHPEFEGFESVMELLPKGKAA